MNFGCSLFPWLSLIQLLFLSDEQSQINKWFLIHLFSQWFLDITFINDSSNVFLAIFVLWKKYSRMLIVGSGNCFPILVMWIRIFLAGPTKPTGTAWTIMYPGKTFSPFNCEKKLVICYSAIYYCWTSGVKTIFRRYFWRVWTPYWLRIRIRTVPLGFNRFWYVHLWSFRLRFGYRVFRASGIRTCSFTTDCSCICISNFGLSSELSGLKKVVTRVDVVFAFSIL